MNLESIISAVESCNTQEELNRSLQNIVNDFGFSSYCFLDIGKPGANRFFYVGTTGEEWEQDYIRNGFFNVDEVIKVARRTNRPFTWGRVPLPPQLGVRKSGAMKVFEAAADHRFTEGLVVPLHFVDPLGRMHSALCSVIWQDRVEDFHKATSSAYHELHLILIYWMQRSIDLREAQRRPQTSDKVFAEREQALGMHLTDRERDVISWAARGKTLGDTAEILSISAETVESYVKNAIIKLRAGNKTHAVAKAIHLGLIDV